MPRPSRLLLPLALLATGALSGPAALAAPAGEPATLIGRLGKVAYYLVPPERARDAAWYEATIQTLCAEVESCFLRFHTNSQGVPPALPLPDAIAAEPTAMFQRSAKHGAQLFRWSCRLGVTTQEQCF